jgi:glycosyltransferase involved in cell wall biosynthesis
MEAMARGLPIVAFRAGGIAELLPDRPGQQLADSRNWDRFAAILCSLITDGGLCVALGNANRLASAEFPAWEETAGMVLRLIRDLGG